MANANAVRYYLNRLPIGNALIEGGRSVAAKQESGSLAKPMVMTGRLRIRDRIGSRPVIWWGVTARRDGGMQLTPLRVREIGAFLKRGIGPKSVPI